MSASVLVSWMVVIIAFVLFFCLLLHHLLMLFNRFLETFQLFNISTNIFN